MRLNYHLRLTAMIFGFTVVAFSPASAFEIAWERLIDSGDTLFGWDDPLGLVEADDGCLIAAAQWNRGLRIFKFNRRGEFVWDNFYGIEGHSARDCEIMRIGRDRTAVFLRGSWTSLRYFFINDDGETVLERSYDFGVSTSFSHAFKMQRDSIMIMGAQNWREGDIIINGYFYTCINSDGDTLFTKRFWFQQREVRRWRLLTGSQMPDGTMLFTGDRIIVPHEVPYCGIFYATTSTLDSIYGSEFLPNLNHTGKFIVPLADSSFLLFGARWIELDGGFGYESAFGARFTSEWDTIWYQWYYEDDWNFSRTIFDVQLFNPESVIIATYNSDAQVIIVSNDGEIMQELRARRLEYSQINKLCLKRDGELWGIGIAENRPYDLSPSLWIVRIDHPYSVRESHSSTPVAFTLGAPYPNPFNSSVRIIFQLPNASPVRVAVFETSGREAALVASRFFPAGSHRISWDAARFAAGEYFIRVEANGQTAVQPVTLVK